MESGCRLITLADAQLVDTTKQQPPVSAGLAVPRMTHLDIREPSASAFLNQHYSHLSRERARQPVKSNTFERATKVHCLNLRSLLTAIPEPIAIRRGDGFGGHHRPLTQSPARPSSALSRTSRSSRDTSSMANRAYASSRRSLNATRQLDSSRNTSTNASPGSDDVRPPIVKILPYLTKADRGVVKKQLVRERLGALFDSLAGPDGYIRGGDYKKAKAALKLENAEKEGTEGEEAEEGGWIDWDGFLQGIQEMAGGCIGKLQGGAVAAAIKELDKTGRGQVAGHRQRPPTLRAPPPAAPHGANKGAKGARRRPASARPVSRGAGMGRKEWQGDLDMDLSGGVPMVSRIPFVHANRVPSPASRIAPKRRPASAPPARRQKAGEIPGEADREEEGEEIATPERLSKQASASPRGSAGYDVSKVMSPIKSPMSPSKLPARNKSRSPKKQDGGPTQPQIFSSEGIHMWPGRWPEKERQQQARDALLASGEHDREAYLSLFLGGRRDGLAQGDDGDDNVSKAERVREARQGMDERWQAQLCAIFDNDFWKDPTKNRIRVKQRVENKHPLPDSHRHLLDKSMQELSATPYPPQ